MPAFSAHRQSLKRLYERKTVAAAAKYTPIQERRVKIEIVTFLAPMHHDHNDDSSKGSCFLMLVC